MNDYEKMRKGASDLVDLAINRARQDGTRLTKKQLAAKAGVNYIHMVGALKGTREASLSLFEAVLAAIGRTLDDARAVGSPVLIGDDESDETVDYSWGEIRDMSPIELVKMIQGYKQQVDAAVATFSDALYERVHLIAEDRNAHREESQRHKAYLNVLVDAVRIVTVDKVVIFENAAHKRLYGMSMLGQMCNDAVAGCSDSDCGLAQVLLTGEPEYRRYERNGKIMAASYTPVFHKNSTVAEVIIVLRDITEQQQSADRSKFLARFGWRIAGIMDDISGDGYCFSDADRKPFEWTENFLEIVELTKDDLENISLMQAGIYKQIDNKSEYSNASMENNDAQAPMDIVLQYPDKQVRLIRRPVIVDDELLGVFYVAHKMSERQ